MTRESNRADRVERTLNPETWRFLRDLWRVEAGPPRAEAAGVGLNSENAAKCAERRTTIVLLMLELPNEYLR